MPAAIVRLATTTLLAALVGGGGYLGYRAVRGQMAADVYRERLTAMAGEYRALAEQYNAAVKRTAVTELLVRGRTLSVIIRTADGRTRTVETRLDPTNEIYVDYAVIDGRLLIRRVFDAWTPPASALVLDEHLADIDWNDPRADHGKAVYRRLDEGRWIITVSGNGSLGLARLPDSDTKPVDLQHAPELRDFTEVVREIETEIDAIGPGDVWRWMRR